MKLTLRSFLPVILLVLALPIVGRTQGEPVDLRSAVSSLEDAFLESLQTQEDHVQVFDKYELELKSLIDQYPGRMEPYMGFSELMEKCDTDRSLRIINEILNTDGLTENVYKRYFNIEKSLQMVGSEVDVRLVSMDGKQIDIGGYRGKVVLVDFWATWCGPCIREIPKLKTYFGEFEEDGLEIIGVSFDDDKSKLEKFISKQGIPWDQVHAFGGQRERISDVFNVTRGYLPTVYLIGRDGRLRYTFNTRFRLKEKIQTLLDESE